MIKGGVVALALASLAALSACGQCGCSGAAGPPGPVGPTASPTSTPAPPAPDLIAFSTIVLEANQLYGQVTVVDVSTPAAPAIVARLLEPGCPGGAASGQAGGQAGIDALGDVVAGVTCYTGADTTSGSLVVFPRTGTTYGSPVTLAQTAISGVAVRGTTLDYIGPNASGTGATLSIDTWTAPATMTPLGSVALDDSSEAYDVAALEIAPGGVYINPVSRDPSPGPFQFGIVEFAPNGASPVASQFSTTTSLGIAVDAQNNVWSLDAPNETNANIVVRTATGAVISTQAIEPRGLSYTIGIQFDRAGNLWLASQNAGGSATVYGAGSTTIYGYLSPSPTAAQLPAPVASFSLANSVQYIQSSKRRR